MITSPAHEVADSPHPARLRERSTGYATDGAHQVATARAEHGYFGRPFSSEPGKLSARDVVRILYEELADEAVVTCDARENRLFVLRDFQAKPGGTVLQPNGGGGMAQAIPSAIAAAVDFPNRPAVAVRQSPGSVETLVRWILLC